MYLWHHVRVLLCSSAICALLHAMLSHRMTAIPLKVFNNSFNYSCCGLRLTRATWCAFSPCQQCIAAPGCSLALKSQWRCTRASVHRKTASCAADTLCGGRRVEAAHDQLQPAAGGVHRQEVHAPRHAAGGPHCRGRHRVRLDTLESSSILKHLNPSNTTSLFAGRRSFVIQDVHFGTASPSHLAHAQLRKCFSHAAFPIF